jgi:hypothetical protein
VREAAKGGSDSESAYHISDGTIATEKEIDNEIKTMIDPHHQHVIKTMIDHHHHEIKTMVDHPHHEIKTMVDHPHHEIKTMIDPHHHEIKTMVDHPHHEIKTMIDPHHHEIKTMIDPHHDIKTMLDHPHHHGHTPGSQPTKIKSPSEHHHRDALKVIDNEDLPTPIAVSAVERKSNFKAPVKSRLKKVSTLYTVCYTVAISSLSTNCCLL